MPRNIYTPTPITPQSDTLPPTISDIKYYNDHTDGFDDFALNPENVNFSFTLNRDEVKKRSPAIPPVALEPPVILHDYFGGGYGVSTRNGSLAARAFREKENIVLEPTYTAKTAAAVMDYCRERDRDDGPVLYWHTYNGVDLSARAQQVDDRDLPKSLRGFIKIGKGL